MPKTPYQRIVEAARKGTGLRLSAPEAMQLAQDTAIRGRAELEGEADAGEVPESRCPDCRGTGGYMDVLCRNCGGSGTVQ